MKFFWIFLFLCFLGNLIVVNGESFILDSDAIAVTSPAYNKSKVEEPTLSWPPILHRGKSSKHKPKSDSKCNSDALRRIIKDNINDNPTTAKRLIHHAALENLNVQVNVICSKSSFSFLIRTTLYCQDVVKDITCFAYKEN